MPTDCWASPLKMGVVRSARACWVCLSPLSNPLGVPSRTRMLERRRNLSTRARAEFESLTMHRVGIFATNIDSDRSTHAVCALRVATGTRNIFMRLLPASHLPAPLCMCLRCAFIAANPPCLLLCAQ